jgi:hypothetical protein
VLRQTPGSRRAHRLRLVLSFLTDECWGDGILPHPSVSLESHPVEYVLGWRRLEREENLRREKVLCEPIRVLPVLCRAFPDRSPAWVQTTTG